MATERPWWHYALGAAGIGAVAVGLKRNNPVTMNPPPSSKPSTPPHVGGARASVRAVYFDFTVRHEGFTPFMYCDTLNLVTSGIGNLLDDGPHNAFVVNPQVMAKALALAWRHKGSGWTRNNPIVGAALSRDEIVAAWTVTKLKEQTTPGFNKQGGFAYTNLTDATLDLATMHALFDRTVTSFDRTLQGRYAGYSAWPADAQLALLSMAWNMGPSFKTPPVQDFTAFKAAVDALDFREAAVQSFFRGGGGTFDKRTGRNAENVVMFNNAADVIQQGIDPERLFFPGKVPAASV